MGLISWIKGKYYDHRLNQADNKVANGDLVEAEQIYISILGKQELAVVHLANMLTVHADTVHKQIANLKQIADLSEFATDTIRSDYQKELDNHLTKMERTAEERFNGKTFGSAVQLIHAVLSYRSHTQQKDKYHRYKAFDLFANSQGVPNYKQSLESAVAEFKEMSSLPLSDLQRIKDELYTTSRYNRTIVFLSHFVDKADWVNASIVGSIVKIVSGKDAEIKNPSKISSFCNITKLSKEASTKLASLSIERASKKDYVTAVSFDKYASEYLYNDNQFNNNRCLHIVDELALRADANEVKSLLLLSKELQLTDTQISALIKKICDIATRAEEVKSIKICQIFKGEKAFDKVYINKAQKLCEQDKCSLVDTTELLEIIKTNTNQDNYADCLGRFVSFLSIFDKEFYTFSIERIIRVQNPELLKKYWTLKPNKLYLEQLINSACPIYNQIVTYIVDNNTVFLSKAEYRKTFCKCVENFKEEDYILKTAEALIKNGCDVEEFYVSSVMTFAKKADDTKAMNLYNRAISIVKNKTIIDAKKALVRKNISEKNYAIAELEAKQLTSIDYEAWTILAELYYGQAQDTQDSNKKVEYLQKVLLLDQSYELKKTFKENKKSTLTELSAVAESVFTSGNEEYAYKICEYISPYQKEWLDLFILLRGKEYDQFKSLGQRIKHINGTLESVHNKTDKEIAINNANYNCLWKILSSLCIEKAESQPKDKAIDSLNQLRSRIVSYCGQPIVNQLTEKLTGLIVKAKWAYGIELEHEHIFDKAIVAFDSAASEHVSSYQKRAEFRSLICHIKEGSIDANIEIEIAKALKEKSFEALREDIAYRYVCYLIKNVRPGDAENLIKTYLPHEKTLLDICVNLYVKEAEVKLVEFNNKLQQMTEGTMSTKDAMSFIKEIDSYKERISKHLPDTSAKFSKYKVQIRAYILKCFFNDEDYVSAFKALKSMHSNFIENETAFRNLAVASLGIIESDCSDKQMLRSAISLAVSAIYTDSLFVHSLEHTSWDDQYTFTLDESLGRSVEDDYESLPDNVNFDEAVDNQNVSIKDVQKNLLLRLETAVREKHSALEDYCQNEIDSLNQILELNLDEHFVLATPGLAKTIQSVETSVREALDYDYNQGYGNQEDVLAVGLMYGFDDGNYSTYKVAKSLLNVCKSALSGSQTNINAAFTASNILNIKTFDKLYGDLKSACSSEMHEAISSKTAYKQFLDKYEVVCKTIKDTMLSMTCANYVNGEIIHRLNDDSMKLRDGIGYMVRIYNLAPSNVQVKQNIEGILKNLIIEIEENGNSLDSAALTKAQRDLSGKFDQLIEDARVQATLGVIIDKVNNNKMNKKDALKKVYELYQKCPNNDRVCQNIVTLCDICISEYIIKDSWDAGTVCSILDALNNGKSATFRKYARKLANEYHDIMNQLPYDTRMLIEIGFSLNSTLNDKGRAFKKGLEYYKKLGGATSARSSLFGDLDLPF